MSGPFLRTTGYSKKSIGPDGKVQRIEVIKPRVMRTVQEAELFVEKDVNGAIEKGGLNPRDGIAIFRSMYYKGTRFADFSKAARRAILCGHDGEEWGRGMIGGIPIIAFRVQGGGDVELNYPARTPPEVKPDHLLITDPVLIEMVGGATLIRRSPDGKEWIPVNAPRPKQVETPRRDDGRVQFQKVKVLGFDFAGRMRYSLGGSLDEALADLDD